MPWHWPKHLNFRPPWLFQKDYLSWHGCQTAILPHEWLSRPLLSLTTIQHVRCPFTFWIFGVLGIMGYCSGILCLEFLAFFSAITSEKKKGIGNRFWDFPSLYMVLASHDRRYNQPNMGGLNGCSHVGTLNSAYWAFSTFEMHGSIAISESSE